MTVTNKTNLWRGAAYGTLGTAVLVLSMLLTRQCTLAECDPCRDCDDADKNEWRAPTVNQSGQIINQFNIGDGDNRHNVAGQAAAGRDINVARPAKPAVKPAAKPAPEQVVIIVEEPAPEIVPEKPESATEVVDEGVRHNLHFRHQFQQAQCPTR